MRQEELFQIGEVSKLYHISVSILRHYDKIGLLSPEYIDEATGYRYYSTRQFECLNTIRYLRALNMPLEKIAMFLNNRDVEQMRRLLEEQKEEIERQKKELEQINHKIENRLKQLQQAVTSELDVISIERKKARRLAILKKQLQPKNYLDLEISIRELEKEENDSVTFLGKVGIGITEDSLKKKKLKPYELVFLVLDEEDLFRGKTIQLPEETCVVTRFQGGHQKAEEKYLKLLEYIEKENFMIAGFSKEITLIDDGLTKDTKKFITEIQIPIRGL